MKFKYYIKIDYNYRASKYITRVNYSTKQFFTDDGIEALAFDINAAEDMLFSLTRDHYRAFIEMHPDFRFVCNPSKEIY